MPDDALQAVHMEGWTLPAERQLDRGSTISDFFVRDASWMKHVPTQPATVLGLELLLQERSLDLRRATELVLSDVGATLQVFQLVAQRDDHVCGLPGSFAVTLASLDVDTWFRAISTHSTQAHRNCAELKALWDHCRRVGQYAKLLAEPLECVCSDLAYMAGLLHEIENMPDILKSDGGQVPEAGRTMQDVLPGAVLTVLKQARAHGTSSVWRYVLCSAHTLASVTPRRRAAVKQQLGQLYNFPRQPSSFDLREN